MALLSQKVMLFLDLDAALFSSLNCLSFFLVYLLWFMLSTASCFWSETVKRIVEGFVFRYVLRAREAWQRLFKRTPEDAVVPSTAAHIAVPELEVMVDGTPPTKSTAPARSHPSLFSQSGATRLI